MCAKADVVLLNKMDNQLSRFTTLHSIARRLMLSTNIAVS
jgi:hypothetical protein